MKISVLNTILYRIPKFPVDEDLKTSWEELKEAIRLSSPAFYDIIKDISKDQRIELPRNTTYTIWKYFNRARFRATPYGAFAGFGIFNQNPDVTDQGLKFNNVPLMHSFGDWVNTGAEKLIVNYTWLQTNSSWYLAGGNIRFIAPVEGGFELWEREPSQLDLEILSRCGQVKEKEELFKEMTAAYAITPDNLEVLIQDLIADQLLFTEYTPNIIGEDYFRRLKIPLLPEEPRYHIAEYPYLDGGIPSSMLKDIPELIEYLSNVTATPAGSNLKIFIQKFSKKFEGREVPIMVALDPETGVGYGELEQYTGEDEFITQFTGRKINTETESGSFLKKAITDAGIFPGRTISLDRIPFIKKDTSLKLPNTMSVVGGLAGDQLYIESIGGATANSLLGRFSNASREVHDFCRDVANLESEANPEVIFFDIAYMSEGYVDNINRREIIYDAQLSILNFNLSNQPLSLSDILVSVQNDNLILRSAKRNKRLVPRMATAYNFTRSDLPVFRLLCELQYQGLNTALLFKIEQLLPGLSYYPRITFKNMIISFARWRIDRKDLPVTGDLIEWIKECRDYLSRLGVSRYFKAGRGDQTLLFDTEKLNDMKAFYVYSSKFAELMLIEAVLPAKGGITDQAGRSYHAEFIFTAHHKQEIYKGCTAPYYPGYVLGQKEPVYPPGSNWLYLEIYQHPSRADEVLTEYLHPLFKSKKDHIRHWFFIRYNSGGDHIRIRLRLKNHAAGHLLLTGVSKVLTPFMENGIVADMQVKTYRPELNRYPAALMPDIEIHFCLDSEYVVALIGEGMSVQSYYRLCADLLLTIGEKGLFEIADYETVITDIVDYFANEHLLAGPDYKLLNSRFREYLQAAKPALPKALQKKYMDFVKSIVALLAKSKPEKRKKLLKDLMHMHINRLFATHQRTHEMVMYYFTLKEMQMRRKMRAN